MCGAAVKGGDALGLVHGERGAKERLVVVVLQITVATLTVKLFANIIAGIEFTTVLE